MTHTGNSSSAKKASAVTPEAQARETLHEASAIGSSPVRDASEVTLRITTEPLRKAQAKLEGLTEVGEAVDETLDHDEDRDSPQINIEPGSELDKLLTDNEIDRDALGDPPLADSMDSLLDRERISLNLDSKGTESTK